MDGISDSAMDLPVYPVIPSKKYVMEFMNQSTKALPF